MSSKLNEMWIFMFCFLSNYFPCIFWVFHTSLLFSRNSLNQGTKSRIEVKRKFLASLLWSNNSTLCQNKVMWERNAVNLQNTCLTQKSLGHQQTNKKDMFHQRRKASLTQPFHIVLHTGIFWKFRWSSFAEFFFVLLVSQIRNYLFKK